MKIDLYIDFDGVILDTMTDTYREYVKYKKLNAIDSISYYKGLDWFTLLYDSSEINDSINNIKKLIASNLYNISILTHVVCQEEISAKKRYLAEKIPGLRVITVDKSKNKCDAVLCVNAILVDDYMENLELWHDKGGISIKFSDNSKKRKFMTIDSLDDLIDKYDDIVKMIEENKSSKQAKKV